MHNSQIQLFNRIRKPRRLISLTPLIDVVFILLVFFMLASSYEKWHSLPLDSVQKGSAGKSNPQSILVRLKTNALDVNGKEMTLKQLNQFIQSKLTSMPALHILIQSHGPVVIQRMVDVIDEVHAAGGKNVSILQN